MKEADFLTLQGTVLSMAAGHRPADPGSSRSGQNQWVAQMFGMGRGPRAGVLEEGGGGTREGCVSVWLWGSRLREGGFDVL